MKSIGTSQLVKALDIPQDIIREIGECATGTMKQCANSQCMAEINVLNEDIVSFQQSKEPIKWNYCTVTKKYWCSRCIRRTVRFDCCNIVQIPRKEDICICCQHMVKCAYCEIAEGEGKVCDFEECEHYKMWNCVKCVCANNVHTGCCYGLGDMYGTCKQCAFRYCGGCDIGRGQFCVNCAETYCEDHLPNNGRLCEECYDFFCNECLTDGKIVFSEHKCEPI